MKTNGSANAHTLHIGTLQRTDLQRSVVHQPFWAHRLRITGAIQRSLSLSPYIERSKGISGLNSMKIEKDHQNEKCLVNISILDQFWKTQSRKYLVYISIFETP